MNHVNETDRWNSASHGPREKAIDLAEFLAVDRAAACPDAALEQTGSRNVVPSSSIVDLDDFNTKRGVALARLSSYIFSWCLGSVGCAAFGDNPPRGYRG